MGRSANLYPEHCTPYKILHSPKQTTHCVSEPSIQPNLAVSSHKYNVLSRIQNPDREAIVSLTDTN